MSKVLTIGPVPSGVATENVVVKTLDLADFGVIEEGPGILKFRDLTTPRTQPTTVRMQQKPRPNVYAGTSVDASRMLANKAGTDTILEVLGLGVETDTVDSSYSAFVPYRGALSVTVPDGSEAFGAAQLVEILTYMLAFLMKEGEIELAGVGVDRILNGVLARD